MCTKTSALSLPDVGDARGDLGLAFYDLELSLIAADVFSLWGPGHTSGLGLLVLLSRSVLLSLCNTSCLSLADPSGPEAVL